MSTELTVQNQRGQALAKYLGGDAMKKRLIGALPRHMTADRMIRVALTAATKNPRLLECSPESVGLALLTASQLGLEPNGRDAHLVPYRNRRSGQTDCQLIPDYKGLIQLAYRSGQVDNVSAKAVYSKDLFEYEFGTDERLKHIPSDSDEPGELVYAWASVRFQGGGAKFVVLNKRDVARRRRASQTADREDSPWKLHPEAMWAKSAVKELSKWMPQTPELESFHKTVEQDDALEFGPVIDVQAQPVESKADKVAAEMEAKKGNGARPAVAPSPESHEDPTPEGPDEDAVWWAEFMEELQPLTAITAVNQLQEVVVKGAAKELLKKRAVEACLAHCEKIRSARGGRGKGQMFDTAAEGGG